MPNKVVRPTGNKKAPKPKPAHDFPFMAIVPGVPEHERPVYRSHKEAVDKLRAEVVALHEQFKHLNTPEIREDCVKVLDAIGKLPRDGGEIDLPLGPVRYQVKLVRRLGA